MGTESIRRGLRAGASALLLLACGPPQPGAGADRLPAPRALPSRPLAQLFVLEAAGVPPDDTTLQVTPGSARVVVLRRDPPDFGLFARVELAERPTASGPQTGELSLRPLPGEYGLDLAVTGLALAGGRILFSYGSHFLAPAGARERYGSDILFERQLAIGYLNEHGEVVFLPTDRPGSDILSAPIMGPGRYLVAAPR